MISPLPMHALLLWLKLNSTSEELQTTLEKLYSAQAELQQKLQELEVVQSFASQSREALSTSVTLDHPGSGVQRKQFLTYLLIYKLALSIVDSSRIN
jgi:Flp pilus assembly protein TadB